MTHDLIIDDEVTINDGELKVGPAGILLVPDLVVGVNGIITGAGVIGSPTDEVDII